MVSVGFLSFSKSSTALRWAHLPPWHSHVVRPLDLSMSEFFTKHTVARRTSSPLTSQAPQVSTSFTPNRCMRNSLPVAVLNHPWPTGREWEWRPRGAVQGLCHAGLRHGSFVTLETPKCLLICETVCGALHCALHVPCCESLFY
jgi:hypothetical protein